MLLTRPPATVPGGQIERTLSRSLSGYLCGTHSGMLGGQRNDRLGPTEVGRIHEALAPALGSAPQQLGQQRWWPDARGNHVEDALRDALDVPGVLDLIFYGSQARRSTTGFSDVDAILVLTDDAVQRPGALRMLRPRVMRAQRCVLEYQPMQHHGFEVVTPTLLRSAGVTLAMPPEAVSQTASLLGRPVTASFTSPTTDHAQAAFHSMADQLARVAAWPRHPWALHRQVSMFELLPALFLQASGQRVEKWRSFDIARDRFADAWRPFETLRLVREQWPVRRYRGLRLLLRVSRNPWVAIATWRRAPVAVPPEIGPLLSPVTLRDLHTVIGLMRAGVVR